MTRRECARDEHRGHADELRHRATLEDLELQTDDTGSDTVEFVPVGRAGSSLGSSYTSRRFQALGRERTMIRVLEVHEPRRFVHLQKVQAL